MPAVLTQRLRQLLLMLSSDQPGEVANAAAAIGRILKSEGRDWHDLVNGLVKDAPQPRQSARADDHDGDDDYCRQMIAFCLTCRARLRPREIEFLESLTQWRGDLTEKQFAWLAAIHQRLRR